MTLTYRKPAGVSGGLPNACLGGLAEDTPFHPFDQSEGRAFDLAVAFVAERYGLALATARTVAALAGLGGAQ